MLARGRPCPGQLLNLRATFCLHLRPTHR
jgi:hypothetical protein